MSYNSQNSKSWKKELFLKKKIDFSIPQNIMTLICKIIDCHNSNIMELTKIQMRYEVDDKLNDTSIATSCQKMSSSARRSETERVKCEKEIFEWLSSLSEKDFHYYSEKISDHIKIYNILQKVNVIRQLKNMTLFTDSKVQKKDVSSSSSSYNKEEKEENKEEKNEEKKDKKDKIIYGDAWDLL